MLATSQSVDALSALIQCQSELPIDQDGCGRVLRWLVCCCALFLSLLVLFREGTDLQQSRDGEKSKEDQCLGKNMFSEEQQ